MPPPRGTALSLNHFEGSRDAECGVLKLYMHYKIGFYVTLQVAISPVSSPLRFTVVVVAVSGRQHKILIVNCVQKKFECRLSLIVCPPLAPWRIKNSRKTKNLPIKLKMFQMPCNARHIIVKTSHSPRRSPIPVWCNHKKSEMNICSESAPNYHVQRRRRRRGGVSPQEWNILTFNIFLFRAATVFFFISTIEIFIYVLRLIC